MAVTNNPDDGWNHDGFAKIASYIPDCGEAIDELMKKFKENQEQAQNDESTGEAAGGEAAGGAE